MFGQLGAEGNGAKFPLGHALNLQRLQRRNAMLSRFPCVYRGLRNAQGVSHCGLSTAEMLDEVVYRLHVTAPERLAKYSYSYPQGNSFPDLIRDSAGAYDLLVETLQERLIAARRDAGLSQKEVAKRTGISQPTYSDLERVKGKGTKHLVKIAAVLGVNPDWLASGRGPRNRGGDPAEQELVALFQGLTADQQRMLLAMLRSASDGQP